MHIIVGLGNPGEEYAASRHNAGRMALEHFRKKFGFGEWQSDKKLNADTSEGKIGKEKTLLVAPNTFMNNSGRAVGKLVSSKKAAEKLLVVYDDLDLPLGAMKISFGRSSGGHNGLESIIRAVKTRDFPRIRLGVAPSTPSGKVKKPAGEQKVVDFLLGDFSKKDHEALPKIFKRAGEAMEVCVAEGYQMGMNKYN
ncbi:MAG: aminoacyl-tRNA hydrolase [Patescibacteria group bacterium]|nr:aminoacyl-tRNA hydrolase [Patescibacteria group bacterium]